LREEIKGMPEREEKSSAEESWKALRRMLITLTRLWLICKILQGLLALMQKKPNLKLLIEELLAKNGFARKC